MVAAGTSELRSTARPFLVTGDLKPGHPVSGRVVLTNSMAQPLTVRVHAVPVDRDLDRLLQVKATAAGKTVFAGTLGDLRHWSRQSFLVPTGAQTSLKTRFWLSKSALAGYQHRTGDLRLEFNLTPAERVG